MKKLINNINTTIEKYISTNYAKDLVNKQEDLNSIIDEIHESFYTEVDKLLETAKIEKSTDSDLSYIIEKSNRLKALGFTNTKECKEADLEHRRLLDIKEFNSRNRELIEAINYFSQKYPLYKFITEDSIKKICNKYNLVYSEVCNYIGDVPSKNLKEIENASKVIFEEDLIHIKKTNYGYRRYNEGELITSSIVSYNEVLRYREMVHRQYINNYDTNNRSDIFYYAYSNSISLSRPNIQESYNKADLIICAPLKDFKKENLEVKDFKLRKVEIPDPIVLQPVSYNKQTYYLILSAWGQEASDPEVVNNKMN